jgi:hypothetical protein
VAGRTAGSGAPGRSQPIDVRIAVVSCAARCAFRDEADKAFEWLDEAVACHDPGLSEILTTSLFDNIRSDPRWLPFLRRIGKAPEQLAKIEFKVTLPKE